jgi:hypothetical protein
VDAATEARAVAAATAVVSSLGLRVDDAVVLHSSNRIAVHLAPCDVLARVGPPAHRGGAEREVTMAGVLAAAGCAVQRLDPRVPAEVFDNDGFNLTLWTFHELVPPAAVAPDEYARALERYHAGLREVNVVTQHFLDRVAEAQHLVDHPALNPDLGDGDRALLGSTLQSTTAAIAARGAPEQLLHGEPHAGNLLRTAEGLLFIDLETTCRGPVAFDVVHAPPEVAAHYPGLDPDLVRACRLLMLAMITMWRFEPGDSLPNRRALAAEWTAEIRATRDG